MIMLISQLTQTEAQPGDEERRPYGPDWTFLVLLAFAALGLVACIRCTVFFVQWLMVRIRLAEAKDRIRARHARDVESSRRMKKKKERRKKRCGEEWQKPGVATPLKRKPSQRGEQPRRR